MSRLIDADALIEFCAERWIPLNIDVVNMQPTIQPVATDTNVGNNSEIPNSSDTISRQAVLDAVEKNACNTQRIMDAVNNLPPAQPEPTDINAKEAVYNLAEKIGIHQLFALTVELRGEPIQPEPQWIPCSERLPEQYGNYLISIHGEDEPDIGTINPNDKRGWSLCDANGFHWASDKKLIVTAWMPLPEPYKERREE